jgi:lysophospholipase L1-like esterase
MALAMLGGSSTAQGATTLGEVDPGAPSGSCPTDTVWVERSSRSGSSAYNVPAAGGVITSWNHRAGPSAGSLKLKILHRVGAGDTASFSIVGESAVESLTPGSVNTFPARIPVAAEDLLGLSVRAGSASCTYPTTDNSDSSRDGSGDPGPGATATFGNITYQQRLNVSAVLEPDADRDGYGDESQDQCPSLASTQGPCPDPALYVALGESYAAGVGASSPAMSYVGRLFADFQADLGVNQLLNRAQGGATSTQLRNGGQLTTAIADINAGSDTRAVTLGIGGNDGQAGCSQRWDDAGACPYRANLAATLGQLRTALDGDPGAEFFAVMAYPNPSSGTGSATEGFADRGLLGANLAIGCRDAGANAGLNDVIYQEAGELGLSVADPYRAFKQGGQAFLTPDHVHPNDAGHSAIVEAFRAASVPCQSPPDQDPPQTSLLGGPKSVTSNSTARLRFRADETRSTFRCRLDRKARGRCTSPRTYKNLTSGRHVFRVWAVDPTGNIDPTPAIVRWKVLAR